MTNVPRASGPYVQAEDIHPHKRGKRAWESLPKGSVKDLGELLMAASDRRKKKATP